MSKREDIIDGMAAAGRKYGLIYTRKCGWVDLGHANGQGALELYRSIEAVNKSPNQFRSFYYSQGMGNRWVAVKVVQRYSLTARLTRAQVKSVALGVFMSVSKDFEGMQDNVYWRQFTDSGFSAEDLVSNLIGFYRAVEAPRDFIALCEPVSREEALYVWDTYGAVGQNKNRDFSPYLYPTNPSSRLGPLRISLPPFLRTITAEPPGVLYKRTM
jgi:hypothetical protein